MELVPTMLEEAPVWADTAVATALESAVNLISSKPLYS